MPNSLRCKLSKLRFQGKITQEEYKELIEKLDGHNKNLRDMYKPKWIPVSEMLPEKNGNYLVTVKYKPERDYDDIYTEYGEWRDGEWDVSGEYCGVIEDIIAYMPLPQPYNAESEDKE